MRGVEFFRELVRAMNRDRKSPEKIGISYKIGQTMIELSHRFLHLLAQKIKGRPFFATRVVNEKIDIISANGSRPESENAACGQKLLLSDLVENFSRVIKKLARLFADRFVFKDRWIATAQFPDVKEWRPVDVFAKIDNRRGHFANTNQFRLRWSIIFPINWRSVRACFFQGQQFFLARLRAVRFSQFFVLDARLGIEGRFLFCVQE